SANLSHARLSDCDLNNANLSLARFASATLWQCAIKQSRANNACFDDALAEVNFWRGSDFAEASFQRSQLSDTDFSGSKLAKATFENARSERAIFHAFDGRGAGIYTSTFPAADTTTAASIGTVFYL